MRVDSVEDVVVGWRRVSISAFEWKKYSSSREGDEMDREANRHRQAGKAGLLDVDGKRMCPSESERESRSVGGVKMKRARARRREKWFRSWI